MVYYVVTLDGTPVGVSSMLVVASQMAKQMETSSKKAVIIPTLEIESAVPEEIEEPDTEKTCLK